MTNGCRVRLPIGGVSPVAGAHGGCRPRVADVAAKNT